MSAEHRALEIGYEQMRQDWDAIRSRCEAAEAEVETMRRAVHTARSRADGAVAHSVKMINDNSYLRSRAERLEAALRTVADSFEDFGRPWDRLPGSIVAARAALADEGAK